MIHFNCNFEHFKFHSRFVIHSRFLLIMAVFLASCSRNVVLQYQDDASNTGTLKFIPSKPTIRTSVRLDDRIMVHKKNVKSITIKQLPAGRHDIHYICDNTLYKEKINERKNIEIKSGTLTVEFIQVPPYSTGFWIYASSSLLAGTILYLYENNK